MKTNRLCGFLNRHKKWLFLLPYMLAFSALWARRDTLLYCHIPFSVPQVLLDWSLFSLFLVGQIYFMEMIRLPWFRKRNFQNAMERAALRNGKGDYPILLGIRSDKNRRHGRIYRIQNNGIALATFQDFVPRLEAALNGKIYKIEYGRKTARTLLYILPCRYIAPTVISLDSKQLSNEPNFLVVGKTGSGKSYALSVLLGIYAKAIPSVRITICDYKRSSFAQFADTPNFYGYEDVPDGIRAFYREFTERLAANDEKRNQQIRVLLIDEYGALISAQDKKTADELKYMVANMLFMGRSLGIRILIGVQRADAEHFKAGARDQFRAILGLGNLSREQKQMLFPDYKDEMTEHNGLGEGYLLMDGQDEERVKVAEIKNTDALNLSIRATMGGLIGEA